MGRKSSAKKKARQESLAQAPLLKEQTKFTRWFKYLFFFSALWLIWDFWLSDHSFIPEKMIWLPILAGGTLAILPIILFCRRSPILKLRPRFDRVFIYFSCFLSGAAITGFIFSGINYYAPREAPVTVQLPVLHTGYSVVRSERQPFTTVRHNDIERNISFVEEDLELVYKTRTIELTLEKGVWGYYIYSNQKLLP